jgi:hypothetical protein
VAAKPRQISEALTPLIKWGLPGLLLVQGISFVASWVSHVHAGEAVPPFVVSIVVVCAVLFLFTAVQCLGLKRVTLTGDALHVSNYLREVVVPLRDVTHVGPSRFGMKTIVVRLAHETDFGRSIIFLPKLTFGGLFWSSPIVDRLRDAVAAAKKTSAL